LRDEDGSLEAFMADSKEMRRLTGKWATGTGWPKRLEWVQIDKVRGWKKERFDLRYPIMAIVGENGVGKSTVLQAIASVYKSKPFKVQGRRVQARKAVFASDYFPDTAWDRVKGEIMYSVRQGYQMLPQEGSLRKPGSRWRGYKERPERQVVWIDLSRIQPISARPGYYKLANPQFKEESCVPLDEDSLGRLSQITGREYEVAKMAYLECDKCRPVPVLGQGGNVYSGWHQGNGETILAELMQLEIPQYSIVLIDEVESSLHPRFQRRLMRDLARLALQRELQIVLTTHSPYILDELPVEARAQITQTSEGKRIMYGISPEFAMSAMDDVPHYECDLYMEDERAERMVLEIMAERSASRDTVLRCKTTKFGAASVGQALGIMKSQNRFGRPTFVFLDGDQGESTGCVNLPGEDAPERVVFESLRSQKWLRLSERIKRNFTDVDDACTQAVYLPDHHDWIRYAASKLVVGADTLWQAMCSEWAAKCLGQKDADRITQPIEDALSEALTSFEPPIPPIATVTRRPGVQTERPVLHPSESFLPFD
jgi:predicted ATPase